MTTLIIIIVAIVAIAALQYNKLQRFSQEVKEKASNVQVAISKKLNLVNQLVEVVKNFQEAEQFTQLKISQDNSDAMALTASYQQSGSLLTSIQGIADRFPNLKASGQYQELMKNIKECENGVQEARERYNKSVKNYNQERSKIPTVFVAQVIGFSEAPFLQFDMAGNTGDNILSGFKTDDGERLNKLLKQAGDKIVTGSKSIASHAEQAGKLLTEKVKEMSDKQYFYQSAGGVPQGPLQLMEIEKQIMEGSIPSDIKLAEKGSSEWKDLQAMKELAKEN